MLPAATALDVTADVDAGVQRIGAVWARGRNDNTIFDVNVSPSDRRSPGTVQRGRWERASTDWASVTPVIMELRRKNGPTQSDVGEWLGRHGIDTAFDFRWSPVPILDGGWAYEPFDVFRRVEQRRPYGYLRLRFAEPVRGPLLLGRGRHYGMGLMAPIEVRVDV